ncbi:MAG: DUF4097 family beta strand repeat protein [Candidatus Hydrothermae bacterium]|nr:DUF4097 family beta strand repeat protein [Candidatus Hydrothermae bacterium]
MNLIMTFMVSGVLLGSTSIEKKDMEGIEVKSRSGDIRLIIEDRNDIYSDDDLNYSEKNGVVGIATLTDNITLHVPPLSSINIKSVSGDIKIWAKSTQNWPSRVMVKSVSGDIRLKTVFPATIAFTTISGDISIEGEIQGDASSWQSALYRATTVSGDIKLKGLVPADLEATSAMGDIKLNLMGKCPRASARVNYAVETGGKASVLIEGQKVEVSENTPLSYECIEITVKTKLLGEEEGKKGRLSWIERRSPLVKPVTYNRVDGFLLGIAPHFGNSNGDFAEIGISYAFGRKTWQGFLHFRKFLVSDPGFYLSAGVFSTTATRDAWKILNIENSLSSFFIKEDFYDYYDRRGIEARLGFSPSDHLAVELGYEIFNLKSLKKKVNWAVFGKNKDFRENPPIKEGTLRALTFNVFARHGPLSFAAQNEVSTNDDYALKRFWNELTFKKSLENLGNLACRMIGGFSPDSLERPFLFTLGGIGSLPGYKLNEFETSRFLLFNLDYSIKIGWPSFLFFFDGAKIDGVNGIKADVGLGVIPFSDISVRAVRKLEKNGDIKVYVRFAKRF